MQLKPVIFFVVVGLVAGSFVYREVKRTDNFGVINIGQQAPDFSIKDKTGNEVKLSDHRGNVVFLNFWATWCTPCVDEMPEMQIVNRLFKDRKFRMMAISVDTDWSYVDKFYEQYKLDLPTYLDPGRKIAELYKTTGYPETFIIGPNGTVLKKVIGHPENWSDPRVLAVLESMLPAGENEDEGQVSSR
jgi:peroxiredoxin